VSRLIIQSILLRADSWLCSLPRSGGQHSDNTHIEKLNRVLVNDICASVPFLLGYDLSQLKKPITNINSQDNKSIWPQSCTSKLGNSKHTGRFSLIWPLYLSCSVSSIPETQRSWMRVQLQLIAEYGEPQAKLVSGAQSQTLFGEIRLRVKLSFHANLWRNRLLLFCPLGCDSTRKMIRVHRPPGALFPGDY